MALDIFHYIKEQLEPSFCAFLVLEIIGKTVSDTSMASRQTICGLTMFTGAITAAVNRDERTE